LVLIQSLYENYSTLKFTNPADRSIAIIGMERRLARDFGTDAAYGLFASYVGRGLLWQRRDFTRMTPIAWPDDQRVPTWSWMCKSGAIKYIHLEFGKIEWTADFKSPFLPNPPGGSNHEIQQTIIRGLARKLILSKSELVARVNIDDGREYQADELRGVIVGKDKLGSDTGDAKHYVLVIRRTVRSPENAYERVGVASLKAGNLSNKGSWVSIQ
jgi:hypothetical protein